MVFTLYVPNSSSALQYIKHATTHMCIFSFSLDMCYWKVKFLGFEEVSGSLKMLNFCSSVCESKQIFTLLSAQLGSKYLMCLTNQNESKRTSFYEKQ